MNKFDRFANAGNTYMSWSVDSMDNLAYREFSVALGGQSRLTIQHYLLEWSVNVMSFH